MSYPQFFKTEKFIIIHSGIKTLTTHAVDGRQSSMRCVGPNK